jgi:hypothetical protein
VRCTNQNDATPPIWEAVTRNLRLQKETFDLVGWIEQTPDLQFVGHVIVGQIVYGSDGLNRVLRCSREGEVNIYGSAGLNLFYTRNL